MLFILRRFVLKFSLLYAFFSAFNLLSLYIVAVTLEAILKKKLS
jgi:hypothetical protein